MFLVGVDVLLGLSVPQSNRPVVSSGHNEATIGGEPGTPHPVTVTT